MSTDPERLARRLLGSHWQQLSRQERDTVIRIARRVRNPEQEYRDNRTLGERAADAIAEFGGSWTFILLFLAFLVGWALLNTEFLGPRHEAFDPYPYVFLNLVLSMLAALQAPIIMMSQNRAAERDRLAAEIDHEVNVRAELAVRDIDRRLHRIERALGVASTESHIADGPSTPL
jgi:uncharacterized membrane protein